MGSFAISSYPARHCRRYRLFSIGFDDPEFDERPYARQVAERHRTAHHEYVVHPDAVDLVERLVWHHDQPFGDSSAVQGLPNVLRTPLEQPLFLLGVIFILIVFFLPGGIAGLASRGRPRGLRRLEEAIRPGGAVGGTPEAGLTEPQEGV